MASGALYVARRETAYRLSHRRRNPRREENVCRHKGTRGISNVTVDAHKALWRHSFSFRTRKDRAAKRYRDTPRHESIYFIIHAAVQKSSLPDFASPGRRITIARKYFTPRI